MPDLFRHPPCCEGKAGTSGLFARRRGGPRHFGRGDGCGGRSSQRL